MFKVDRPFVKDINLITDCQWLSQFPKPHGEMGLKMTCNDF